MMTNNFQAIIFIQPMRRLDMHFGGPIIFFVFWVWWGKGFFCCPQCIPIEFPSSSHSLPFTPFPSPKKAQCVPNSTTLLSYMLCPKLNLHIYIYKQWRQVKGKKRHASILGSGQCLKRNIGDGPIKVAPSQNPKKKPLGCTSPSMGSVGLS
jgi:hypothetical protein